MARPARRPGSGSRSRASSTRCRRRWRGSTRWGITLRDIDTGLIDFPALVTGRQVWLCWRLGEGDVDWWHELNVGFAGRRAPERARVAGARRRASIAARSARPVATRPTGRCRPAEREAAVLAALDAWARGDWFETHERLEPAWMGSDDLAERLRLQAAIKVAAAFVHQARRNRAGVRTNLVGARARLDDAGEAGAERGRSRRPPSIACSRPSRPSLFRSRRSSRRICRRCSVGAPRPAATRSAIGPGTDSRARAPSAGARTPSRSRSAG